MQSFEIFALFSLVLFFNAFGSVLLKKGASQGRPNYNFGKVRGLAAFAGDMVTSKKIVAGLLMQIFAFVGWLAFISHVALNFAFSLSSINNVTILLASRFLLHEHISSRRWCGVLFILGGIILITTNNKF